MSLASPPQYHRALDLRDQRCPHVLIAVVRAMETLASGEVVRVEATDLTAPSNLIAWSRQSGNRVVDAYDEDGVFVIFLQRLAPPPAATDDTTP